MRRTRLALVIDPRFPGGTSGAVAAEIAALAGHVDLSVVALGTAMFKGREVNPRIAAALAAHGLCLEWDPPVVRADAVVVHNPSCLRFNETLATRISCQRAFVVTHENFLRPNGEHGFDVDRCLGLLEGALVCGERWLAPISAGNRATVQGWPGWPSVDFDWHNVFDPEVVAPTRAPRDRRGRHSRPGFEKFPGMDVMRAHFPAHAERCAILGGDSFLLDPEQVPRHWEVKRFGEMEVEAFLSGIDFFVYYTHPLWRESFGRVIAEAIAAGKVVITDPATARTFGDAVVASEGADIDAIIAGFIAEPRRYVDLVRAAQASLARFSPAAFRRAVLPAIRGLGGGIANVAV